MRIPLNDDQLKIVKLALNTLSTEDISTEKPVAEILERIENCEKESKDENLRKYAKAAQKRQRDGEIEIDDDAVVSKGEDAGAYVEAWLWVGDDELEQGEDEEACRECGKKYATCGDGYDGMCPDCADKAEDKK